MQRALDSAIGLPRRSTNALWIVVFLMPAEVSRNFMIPLCRHSLGLVCCCGPAPGRGDEPSGSSPRPRAGCGAMRSGYSLAHPIVRVVEVAYGVARADHLIQRAAVFVGEAAL